MEFGEKLKRAREEQGMTQQTLADQLFVTRQAVSRWECGARFPDLLTAKKISEILEVSLDELLSDEESRKFVEENPIVSSTAVSTIQAGFYGFAGMTFLILSITWIPVLIEFEQYELNMIPMVLSRVCSDFGMTILMILGFCFAVKGKLNPKNTALLPILYSLFEILKLTASYYFHFTFYTPTLEPIIVTGMSILFYILCIVSVFEFFIKDKKIFRYCIYGLFTVEMIDSIYVYITEQMEEGMFSYFNFSLSTVSTLGIIAFICLVFYQTHVLYKKRCQAAKK